MLTPPSLHATASTLSLTLCVRTAPTRVRAECPHDVRCCPSAAWRSLVLLSFSPQKGSAVPLGTHCPCCGAHTGDGTPHRETHSAHTHHGHTERHSSHGQQQSLSSFLLKDRMKRDLCETSQCFLFFFVVERTLVFLSFCPFDGFITKSFILFKTHQTNN